MSSDNKCQKCSAKCCSYVSQQIDTPRSIASFDFLLWQLSHEGIQLYKDEDGWFLLINNRCSHIQGDGSCGIYEIRPQICRDHSNDYCEYDSSAEEGFELFFNGYEKLDNYCRDRFKSWDRRFKKSKSS